MMLTGPDVSHHQGDVDMAAVRRAGHSFVGIKVSEGTSYRDPMLDRNRGRAVAAGLIRLLYHFCRPGPGATIADATAEAAWFARCIGTLQAGEIVVADMEDDKATGDVSAWTLAFLAEVDRLTGRAGGSTVDDAVLYTYAPFARTHLRLRPAELAARPLWLAAYSTSPTVPAPWRSWTFWQHTSSGSCPGITGRCDLNRFDGPYSALQALAGMTPTISLPTAPSDEEDLLMPAAKSDDDARRTLIRDWCWTYWGVPPTAAEMNILAVFAGEQGTDATLAHITDHPKATAYRARTAA